MGTSIACARLGRSGPGVGAHRDHAVAEVDRFLQVVRDEEDGELVLARQAGQLVLQALPRERVQGAEGFVQQHERGPLRQAARDLRALLHAARQLRRKVPAVPLQAHLAQRVGNTAGPFAARRAGGLQRQGHVAFDRAPRQQRAAVVLEHHRRFARGFGHQAAVAPHLALAGWQQPGGGAQQRGLAAAAGADDADELAARDVQAGERDDVLAAQADRHAVEAEEGFARRVRGEGLGVHLTMRRSTSGTVFSMFCSRIRSTQ
jgi:hypothetical protein